MEQAITQNAEIYKIICVPVHLKATKIPGGSLSWHRLESEMFLSSECSDIHSEHIATGFISWLKEEKKSSTDKDHHL